MRAAFIPALPPSALMGGMIAPSFRLVNRFSRKKLLRTCGPKGPPALCALFSRSPLAYVLLRTFGRRERPPALCAIFSWSPLAYVKGSLPFDRSLWHGPPLRRTQAAPAFRAPSAQETRLAAPRSPPRRASRPHPSSEVWRAAALQHGIRIQRHARWIRQPCASKATLRRPPPAPKGSVCPVGTCAKRKATRRREQIQGLRAASAQNADICEVPAAKPPAK